MESHADENNELSHSIFSHGDKFASQVLWPILVQVWVFPYNSVVDMCRLNLFGLVFHSADRSTRSAVAGQIVCWNLWCWTEATASREDAAFESEAEGAGKRTERADSESLFETAICFR